MTRYLGFRNGQVGLVVLLIMTVMLTVGVSVASRSVTELRISRQEQESTRALDFAESGIEAALSNIEAYPLGTHQITVDGQEVTYTLTDLNTIDVEVAAGHTVQVALAGSAATRMTLSWDINNLSLPCDNAAIEVAQFVSGSNVKRTAYQPDSCSGTYEGMSSVVPGADYSTDVLIESGAQFARVKVLGIGTRLRITGADGDLPAQTKVITSTATLSDGTTRTVEVRKMAESYPSIFDYVLFSGDTLVKN